MTDPLRELRLKRAGIKKTIDPSLLEPDWKKECSNCGEKPVVPATGMCGPCTFGEFETCDGKW